MQRSICKPALCLFCLSVLVAGSVHAGDAVRNQSVTFQEFLDSAPPRFAEMFRPRHLPPHYSIKSAGPFPAGDWQAAIDSIWGTGLGLDDRKMFFDSTWNLIDGHFPGFHGLDPAYWDDIRDLYWPEIENPSTDISKGRFCAIMQRSFMGLGDDHTRIFDMDVVLTALLPGVPLLVCSSPGVNDHFGAALTPLADSTLLVYKAVENHPLGLVPGDLVLGYDGILWKDLYPQLLDAYLPMVDAPYHTTDKTFLHSMLSAAGLNWHLFDTIDVVSYATGDTLHLPTDLLGGQTMQLWATEQMEIPGVPQPNPYFEEIFSWGYIEGTQIAYIYTYGWWGNEAELLGRWESALDSILYNPETSGLIIDDRTNWGTMLFSFLDPINRLFDTTIQTFRWFDRCSETDHYDMCPQPYLAQFINAIEGEAAHFYNRPIAVLTGPYAASGGDLFPLSMSFHPMVKIFGKPTCGAFSTVAAGNWIYPNWQINLTFSVCSLADNPGDYVLRKVFPNAQDFPWVRYEEVWLTREGVAQGRDDVVEAATNWILSGDIDADGILNPQDNCPGTYNPQQEDADGDGVGNACDVFAGQDNYADPDGDAVPLCYDNCPAVPNADQVDSDHDGIGDDCEFSCGDANSDETVNVGDAVYIINYVFRAGSPPDPECVGDANGDSVVNVADAVYLIAYIFNNGPPPPAGCCL